MLGAPFDALTDEEKIQFISDTRNIYDPIENEDASQYKLKLSRRPTYYETEFANNLETLLSTYRVIRITGDQADEIADVYIKDEFCGSIDPNAYIAYSEMSTDYLVDSVLSDDCCSLFRFITIHNKMHLHSAISWNIQSYRGRPALNIDAFCTNQIQGFKGGKTTLGHLLDACHLMGMREVLLDAVSTAVGAYSKMGFHLMGNMTKGVQPMRKQIPSDQHITLRQQTQAQTRPPLVKSNSVDKSLGALLDEFTSEYDMDSSKLNSLLDQYNETNVGSLELNQQVNDAVLTGKIIRAQNSVHNTKNAKNVQKEQERNLLQLTLNPERKRPFRVSSKLKGHQYELPGMAHALSDVSRKRPVYDDTGKELNPVFRRRALPRKKNLNQTPIVKNPRNRTATLSPNSATFKRPRIGGRRTKRPSRSRSSLRTKRTKRFNRRKHKK